jgi:hypothetical protein
VRRLGCNITEQEGKVEMCVGSAFVTEITSSKIKTSFDESKPHAVPLTCVDELCIEVLTVEKLLPPHETRG